MIFPRLLAERSFYFRYKIKAEKQYSCSPSGSHAADTVYLISTSCSSEMPFKNELISVCKSFSCSSSNTATFNITRSPFPINLFQLEQGYDRETNSLSVFSAVRRIKSGNGRFSLLRFFILPLCVLQNNISNPHVEEAEKADAEKGNNPRQISQKHKRGDR